MDYKTLANKLNDFKEFIEESGTKFFSFESHPYIKQYESYKSKIYALGNQRLKLGKWRKTDIGTGKIIQAVRDSIEVEDNNLLVHDNRNGEAGRSDKSLYQKYSNEELEKYEAAIFDFYFENVTDEVSFNRIVEFSGKKYPFLAYLFFLKSKKKYLPIAPRTFDNVFKSLGIDFKTEKRCSWGNYNSFLNILIEIQSFLQANLHFEDEEITLLDTHTFLWIIGAHMKNWESKLDKKGKEIQYKFKEIAISKREINHKEKIHKLSNRDYLKEYVHQNRLGQISENIVLDFESKENKFVEKVSDDNSLGFDIAVKNEKKEIIKRIEVKTESFNSSFIITENEIQKSKEFDNYYIYIVRNPESKEPLIQQIKPIDILKNMTCIPINYRVYF